MNGQLKHILVVEDEEHLATGIKFNLEAEGYRVTVLGDGPSAVTCVVDGGDQIDLLILDLMLPGMSGYAVCEAIRGADFDLPILMLTARTLTEDRTRGFDVGADQYLTKPFDLDELLSRVRSMLALYGRRTQRKPLPVGSVDTFTFGNVSVNFRTFEASVANQPVQLTNLEMKLLQHFVENRDRVIPRHELLEKVWGIPGHVNTRAVDQFIRRLRKIFEPDAAQPIYFLTIRDAGYRFVPRPEEGGGK